jgi:hypothetical protein
MISFKDFLSEGYKNLFTKEQKQKYAQEAYDQLVQSYTKVGGLHGAGFKDVQDFVDNIPFWKLRLGKDGHIVAAAYYKDRAGRKRVAVSSDRSREGMKYVVDAMLSDFSQGRSYGEVSSASLTFLVKRIGYDEVLKHAIKPEDFAKISGDEIREVPEDDAELRAHPELKDFLYQRVIGKDWHTKIAVGTPGKSFF